jgi:hypothetical protein
VLGRLLYRFLSRLRRRHTMHHGTAVGRIAHDPFQTCHHERASAREGSAVLRIAPTQIFRCINRTN